MNGIDIPDIHIEHDNSYNPTLSSPNSLYVLQFYQTKESLMDIEVYKKFLDNAIARFRHSRLYKQYKGFLIDLGMNKCQLFGNINIENTKVDLLEMHHNFLTIYDIALLITEHVINTRGYICTFELVQLLKEEHRCNRVPIVMLSKTAHQIFHNNQEMVLPAKMCYGYWAELLMKYNRGITIDIANKVITFIKKSIEDENNLFCEYSQGLLKLRDNILSWTEYNDYADTMRISTVGY